MSLCVPMDALQTTSTNSDFPKRWARSNYQSRCFILVKFSLELENSFTVQREVIYFDLERDGIECIYFFADASFLSKSKNNKYICLPA